MPPVAAVGASIMSAVGGITLSGLATGAMVAGTAMTAIGAITGNKTISKIGMGLGLAGGVGSMATSAMGTANQTLGKTSTALLEKTPGLQTTGDLLKPKFAGGATASAESFIKNADSVGKFDPELSKSFFDRANTTLTKYSGLMNIAGGMGEAYMVNEQNQVRKDLLDKEINFQQNNIDWQHRNNSVPLPVQGMQVTRKPNAYAPLLQRQ